MTETATYSKNDVFYTCSLIEYCTTHTRPENYWIDFQKQ